MTSQYKLVPCEPTDEMLDAFWRAMFNEPPGESGPVLIGAGYDAMLAAAPSPPRDASGLLAIIDRLTAPSASVDGWQTIESAPKDGTLVDLLYPHPYGRTINCRWTDRLEIGWHWTTPKWGTNGFLIESEWMTSTHPISPTHWMPLPAPPAPIPSTASGDE